MFNYGFDNFAGFPDIHDIGIVILDQAIELDEYATLASANTVDQLATARGTQDVTMRVSGYGLSLRHLVGPRPGRRDRAVGLHGLVPGSGSRPT